MANNPDKVRVVRVLVYEGTVEWVSKVLARNKVKGSYTTDDGAIYESVFPFTGINGGPFEELTNTTPTSAKGQQASTKAIVPLYAAKRVAENMFIDGPTHDIEQLLLAWAHLPGIQIVRLDKTGRLNKNGNHTIIKEWDTKTNCWKSVNKTE